MDIQYLHSKNRVEVVSLLRSFVHVVCLLWCSLSFEDEDEGRELKLHCCTGVALVALVGSYYASRSGKSKCRDQFTYYVKTSCGRIEWKLSCLFQASSSEPAKVWTINSNDRRATVRGRRHEATADTPYEITWLEVSPNEQGHS